MALNADIAHRSYIEFSVKVLSGELLAASLTRGDPDEAQKLAALGAMTAGQEQAMAIEEQNSDMFTPDSYYVSFTSSSIGCKFLVSCRVVTRSIDRLGHEVGRSHRSATLLKFSIDPALKHAQAVAEQQKNQLEENVRRDHQI